MKIVTLSLLSVLLLLPTIIQSEDSSNFTSSEELHLLIQNSSSQNLNLTSDQDVEIGEVEEWDDDHDGLVRIPLNSEIYRGIRLEVTSSEAEGSSESTSTSSESLVKSAGAFGAAESSSETPYLPLLTRCSSDTDCPIDRSCEHNKCLISPTHHKIFGFLPRFIRCRQPIDCPSGNKCLFNKCIPFHW